jgi:hypothetical protein
MSSLLRKLPRMCRRPSDKLSWLSQPQRAWVKEHRSALDAMVAALERDGNWPDPVQLERQLRSQKVRVGVLEAVGSMPPALGWREHSPPRVMLTLLGFACVPRARPLLEALLATMRLALTHFDSPGPRATLSRSDVQRALGADHREMDLLSLLVLGPGNFFLGGGIARPDSWELEIDERIVLYEDVATVEDLIARLAEERPTQAILEMPEPAARVGRSSGVHSALVVAVAAAGLATNIAAFFTQPPWAAIGVMAATATAVALHRRLTASPPSLWAIAAVAAVGVIAAGIAYGVEKSDGPPAVHEQLSAIVRDARKEHRRLLFHATAPLHGQRGSESEVLVLRDDRIPDPPPGDAMIDSRGRFIIPRSDEIRIYDVAEGRLREAFRFLPQGAGQIKQLPEGDRPQFHFIAQAPADLDGDGRPEVIGAFERVTLATAPLPAPVVLAWDGGARRYRLSPLIARAPGLHASNRRERAALEGYTKPTIIVDRYSRRRVHAYAIDTYKVIRSRPYALLVGGYLDQEALISGHERYKLQAWTLDLQNGAVETSACFGSPVTLSGRVGNDLASALARWFARYAPPGCEP